MNLFSLGQCIADLEDTAIVRQTYDVAWVSLLDRTLTLCHELGRGGETHCLSIADVQVRLVALELSRAHLAESDATAVVGVDIGRDLEDEASELRLCRFYHAFFRFCRTWTGSDFYETVEQFLYTEVVQCRAEEYRCNLRTSIGFYIKVGIDTIDQFEVVAKLSSKVCTDLCIQFL